MGVGMPQAPLTCSNCGQKMVAWPDGEWSERWCPNCGRRESQHPNGTVILPWPGDSRAPEPTAV
jgi:predicted amidophosphoribosyltransferase